MILCSSSVQSTLPFEEAMATIDGAGFRDVDLLAINTWCHINPKDLAADYGGALARVESALKKHNLAMRAMNVGFTHQLHDRRPESVRQNLLECEAVCMMMNYFGASVAALQPLQKDPARERMAALDDCIASLREYYECAGRRGIKLGLELHANSPFEDRFAMDYLFEKIPDAGVVYDPSHFTCQGMGLRESEFIIRNCVHAHLRDSGAGAMQTPLGAGDVDFEWIADKLAEYGYKGHISIEYLDNPDYDAIGEAIKMREVIENNVKFSRF